MTQQIINIGAFPNDGTGDPVRTAMTKCNSNFDELYAGDLYLLTNNPHAYGTLTVSNLLGGNTWTLSPGNSGSNSININATGPDTNININHIPKGAGGNNFYCQGVLQVSIAGPVGATRYISMQGSVSGNPRIVAVNGGAIEIPDLVMVGVPTAPTAAPGTSTTQVATTAFVAAFSTSLLASNNTWTGSNFFNGPNVVVGHTAAIAPTSYKLQTHSAASAPFDGNVGVANWGTAAGGFGLHFSRSKSGVVGTHTAVVLDDYMGQIAFRGSDGSAFVTGATIDCLVDGAVAAGQVPGRISFLTRPVGGAGLLERMRLTQGGLLQIFNGGTAPPVSLEGLLGVAGTSGGIASISVENYQNAAGSAFVILKHSRGAYGTQGALQANDPIGTLRVDGSDGSGFVQCGAVQFMCHSAPTAGRVPTRISFLTDNGTNFAERVRIYPSGGLVSDSTIADPGSATLAARASVVRQAVDTGVHAFLAYNTAGDAIGRMYVNANKHLEVHNSAAAGFQVFTNNDDVNPVATFLGSGVAIKGTNTNDDAAAGFVGQYFEGVLQAPVALVANAPTNVTSCGPLSGGDWDIIGHASFTSAANNGGLELDLNTASATLSGLNQRYATSGIVSGSSMHITTPIWRLKVAAGATPTVFLVCRAAVVCNVTGAVIARRVR